MCQPGDLAEAPTGPEDGRESISRQKIDSCPKHGGNCAEHLAVHPKDSKRSMLLAGVFMSNWKFSILMWNDDRIVISVVCLLLHWAFEQEQTIRRKSDTIPSLGRLVADVY